MSACQDCEDGRCPCGTGCLACVLTGQCPTCNGTASQDAPTPPDLRFTRHRRPAAVTLRAVKPRCVVCDRFGTPLVPPLNFDGFRTRAPGTWKREMKARRCVGCHRRFTASAPRTPTYTLTEEVS